LKTKTVLKKWLLLAATTVLLITALGIFALPAAAADPPQLVTVPLSVDYPSGNYHMDIYLDGKGPKAGWCINKGLDIIPGYDYSYTATLYDYFGRYQDGRSASLELLTPDATYVITDINWKAIAYILNNKIGDADDVQWAIWWFTNHAVPDPPNSNTLNTIKMITAAEKLENQIVPRADQQRPIICFIKLNPYYPDENVTEEVQPVFFEYDGQIPSFPVPELSSLALFGLGLAGIGGFIFSKRRARKV
jgi:hypothetical protein